MKQGIWVFKKQKRTKFFRDMNAKPAHLVTKSIIQELKDSTPEMDFLVIDHSGRDITKEVLK